MRSGWTPLRNRADGARGAQPCASPAATVPPTAAAFPLADLPLEFVIDDNGVISVIGSDGSGQRRIGEDVTGLLVSPEWLPGTDRVIVQDWAGDTDQVWDVDTTGERRSLVVIPCVEPCRSRNEASPSRDGSRIVFFQAFGDVVDDIPTTCGLAVYEVRTQAMTTVTESPCAVVEEHQARFSPGGDRIAFWRSRSPGGERTIEVAESALFIRDLDTEPRRRSPTWTSKRASSTGPRTASGSSSCRVTGMSRHRVRTSIASAPTARLSNG